MINMKCPQDNCKVRVKDNTDYSVHMNRAHRGESYQPLEFKSKEKHL